MKSRAFLAYTRNFIFGAEDSLVSTVGLLAGIAVGGLSRRDIILTGFILILVEAFSMGVGSYLSEYTTEESEIQPAKAFHESIVSSLIMFVSYVLTGLIPLAPFFFVPDNYLAAAVSVGFSLAALFVLGVISSKILSLGWWKIAVRMTVLGGIATAVGIVIGRIAGV